MADALASVERAAEEAIRRIDAAEAAVLRAADEAMDHVDPKRRFRGPLA